MTCHGDTKLAKCKNPRKEKQQLNKMREQRDSSTPKICRIKVSFAISDIQTYHMIERNVRT